MVRGGGFDIVETALVDQDNEDGRFLWIIAGLSRRSAEAKRHGLIGIELRRPGNRRQSDP
jgi:hypothetical protein